MVITDEAKSLITKALVSNGCDSLQVSLKKSCCGTSTNLAPKKLQAGDRSELINGVSVMMDEQTQVRAKEITLAARNGKIIIQDANSCCS